MIFYRRIYEFTKFITAVLQQCTCQFLVGHFRSVTNSYKIFPVKSKTKTPNIIEVSIEKVHTTGNLFLRLILVTVIFFFILVFRIRSNKELLLNSRRH